MHVESATDQVQVEYLQQPMHDKDTMINMGVAGEVGEGAVGKTCACKAYH